MEGKPTIIGVADATHYLVGTTDIHDNFIALPQFNKIALCNSLSEAKQLLRDNNIYAVQLTLQTAYDEMCGLPSIAATKQSLQL
jgi:hypothetical protein